MGTAKMPLEKTLFTLADIIGQAEAVRRLREFAALYAQAGKPPGHILLTGINGIGKRTIARAFATEFCGRYTEADTGSRVGAESFVVMGDMMGSLTKLGEGEALLVTDISRISKKTVSPFGDCLREFRFEFVVDKGMFARSVSVPLKRFTCLATATSKAKCPAELIEAFPLVVPLQGYSHPELVSICQSLFEQRDIAVTPAAADIVASQSAGTPHEISVLVDRVAALGRDTISAEDISEIASALGLAKGPASFSSVDKFETLTGIDFEKLIAGLLQRMGFCTEMTEVTGDGGIDIRATLDQPLIGGLYLFQCKRYATGKLIGEPTVRDFYGALTKDQSAIKGLLITTSGFTGQAVAFARGLPIELIDGQKLRGLLKRYGISVDLPAQPSDLFQFET